jgi:hypothetical protein
LNIADLLHDPEWLADPDGQARREALRVIEELRAHDREDRRV